MLVLSISRLSWLHIGSARSRGYFFAGPCDKDYNVLGSILESPCCGKLPDSTLKIAAVPLNSHEEDLPLLGGTNIT